MAVRDVVRQVFQNVAVRALTTVERVQTGVAFNPLDKNFRRNPYPLYRELQTKDPFHRSRLGNGWVLSRYEDIATVLKDGRFLVDDRKMPQYEKNRQQMIKRGIMEDVEDVTQSMLRSDPPDHTRLRSLVSKAFTPRSIEALRPRIETIVQEQLDAVAGNGGMDVIRDIAYPLPVTVIAEMIGVPIADLEKFKDWSDEVILLLGTNDDSQVRRGLQADRELREYFAAIAEERRRDPRDDLLSALLAAEEEGDKLTMGEVYSTCVLLLVAGNETTTNLIGNSLLALLRHPDQLALLRDDPSLIVGAVEELLRYDSPVQATSRFPLEAVAVDGHTVEAGQECFLMLGAANRDPERFDDPDRLDITHTDKQHLSFSNGIHACLGAPLARLEGQIAIGAIADRFANLRLATDDPKWRDNLILRGLESLPVTF